MPTCVYSPFLLVLVSYFRVTPPWYSMVTTASAIGWPLSSMIFPRAVPVWARAADPARARARNSPPVTNKRFIAWSSRGALRPRNLSILSRCAGPGLPPPPVGNGVLGLRLREALEAQEAALAGPARLVLGLVARPGLLEGRRELPPPPDDLGLGQRDHGGDDMQVGLRPRALADRLLERAVELGPAVRVAGGILPHRAHEDGSRPQRLAPGGGRGEQMGIAKRNIGRRDHAGHRRSLAHGNRRVGEAAAADRAQVREVHHERALRAEVLGQEAEALQLFRLGALAVISVEEGQAVLGRGDGGGEAGVHAAADANDRQRLHTPLSTPGQRYLWSWTCSLAGSPSCRIQPASSPGSRTPCTGENRTGQ